MPGHAKKKKKTKSVFPPYAGIVRGTVLDSIDSTTVRHTRQTLVLHIVALKRTCYCIPALPGCGVSDASLASGVDYSTRPTHRASGYVPESYPGALLALFFMFP